jgi:hypothetical protein
VVKEVKFKPVQILGDINHDMDDSSDNEMSSISGSEDVETNLQDLNLEETKLQDSPIEN